MVIFSFNLVYVLYVYSGCFASDLWVSETVPLKNPQNL